MASYTLRENLDSVLSSDHITGGGWGETVRVLRLTSFSVPFSIIPTI